jgi:hypothetical protein
MSPLSTIEMTAADPCYNVDGDESFCLVAGETTNLENGPLSPKAGKIAQRPLVSVVRQQRRVSFSKSKEVLDVTHINDLSAEDVTSVWWTTSDYNQIKRMYKITVQRMMHGVTFAKDDPNFCERGLEFRTKAGSQRRHRQKERVRKALATAQDFQYREGFRDPLYIAEMCAEYSRGCCNEARARGLSDRAEVQGGLKQ